MFYSVFDEARLKSELQLCGVKALHVYTIWNYLLGDNALDVEAHEVPGLPQLASSMLQKKFKTLTSRVEKISTSSDGSTTKILVTLQNKECTEAVIMRHDTRSGTCAGAPRLGGPRATLCVSSQIGCKMGCNFCATGTMGLVGNLSAGEIVEQLVHALKIEPIRNVVFMGMGEPLNNYAAVVQACQTITGRCFGLSPHHITVSTVGIIPRILQLADDLSGINLALSLHAPTQELRCKIVPAAKAFKLEKLMSAIDSYQALSKRMVLVEYVMLAGINDSEENAHQLGNLLHGRKVVVNLIPYNPTDVLTQFKPSTKDDVHQFQKIIRDVYGIRATVRQEMGQDIGGACGQLVIGHRDKQTAGAGMEQRTSTPCLQTDIEDMHKLCSEIKI